jgi:catechol 2,3-dioxygenase-like lactoylglutathione lyase family enzyme
MVRAYGLTHINLVVRDVERSLRFYWQVFGVEEYGRTKGLVHTRTPGCHDVISFDEHSPGAGESRGIVHFGFRLVSPPAVHTRNVVRWHPAPQLLLPWRTGSELCGAWETPLSPVHLLMPLTSI